MSQVSTTVSVGKDSSKKHNLITGTDATFYAVFKGQQKKASAYFYCNGQTSHQTMDVAGATTVSSSFHFDSVLTSVSCTVVGGDGGGSWVDSVSGSAVRTYGSKATARATSSSSGGYHKPGTDLTVTFTVGYTSNVDEQFSITNVKLYYKESSVSSYSTYAESSSADPRHVTVPGSAFVQGKIYNSYAVVTFDDGQTYTIYLSDFNTVDGTPHVTVASPINLVTYGTVNFEWRYSVSTGLKQYAFDLQISTDNQTFTSLANHSVTDQTSYTAKISTGGTIYWKVRAYNQDNVASEWSSGVSFVNNMPPDPPTIVSISAVGRPEISWSASDQIAYRVRIVSLDDESIIVDSGERYSSEKKYKVEQFLDDGNYMAQIRITSSLGKTSEWASALYSHTSELGKPVLTARWSEEKECVEIQITPDSTVSYYELIRNGVAIAAFKDSVYDDLYGNGDLSYRLIAVASDGGYGYEDLQTRICCPDPHIVLQNGKILKINKRVDDPVQPTRNRKAGYTSVQFFNSSAPQHLFSSMKTGDLTVAFFDSEEIADSILGEIVYYADPFGNSQWYAVTAYAITDNWVEVSQGKYTNEVTLTMEETDGKEEIHEA